MWLVIPSYSQVKSAQENQHTTQKYSQKKQQQPISPVPTPIKLQDFLTELMPELPIFFSFKKDFSVQGFHKLFIQLIPMPDPTWYTNFKNNPHKPRVQISVLKNPRRLRLKNLNL